MALPRIDTPTYQTNLPSTGQEVQFRPFLVKEQKTMLMAQEANSDSETLDSMSQLISDCTFGKVDQKTSPLFDIEFLFLRIRGKSVGETTTLSKYILSKT